MCQGIQRASAGRLCCPRLAVIHIQNASPRRRRDSGSEHDTGRAVVEDSALWLGVLRDTLRERAQAGMKLQEFVLVVFRSSQAGSHAHGRYDAHLAQLRPFVERARVEYEDLVLEDSASESESSASGEHSD